MLEEAELLYVRQLVPELAWQTLFFGGADSARRAVTSELSCITSVTGGLFWHVH